MSGPIRVLHLIKTLSLGGAETNLYNLVHATDTERIEAHVGYSYGGEIEERFRRSGVRLFKYSSASHRVKSFATVGIVWRLARYILRHRIHIVHTHNFNSHVWGCLAAKLAGAKIVEHVHDFRYMDPESFVKGRGENSQYRYVKYLKNISDRVVVLTKQNRDYLLKHSLYPEDKIRRIQNGIPFFSPRAADPEIRRELEIKHGVPHNKRIVLTTARMAPEKNIDLLLEVAPLVARERPDAVFVIAGDGPLLSYLRERAEKEGLAEAMKFIGFQSDTTGLLAHSDVFVLPSFLELHSISLLEAMSLSVPVVVSKGVGCHEDFLEDWVNGVLLDPSGPPVDWARAVIRLLKEPALKERIAREAYITCRKRFHIHAVAREKEALYAELAGE